MNALAEINQARLAGWLEFLETQNAEALCVIGLSQVPGTLGQIEIVVPPDVSTVELQTVLEAALAMLRKNAEGN